MKDLALPPTWWEKVSTLMPKDAGLLKSTLPKVQYTPENAKVNLRPTPDTANFITTAELMTASKDVAFVQSVEKKLQYVRSTFREPLASKVDGAQAVQFMEMVEMGLVRLMFSKTPTASFKHNVSGKWSEEKANRLIIAWVAHLEGTQPALKNLATDCGITMQES